MGWLDRKALASVLAVCACSARGLPGQDEDGSDGDTSSGGAETSTTFDSVGDDRPGSDVDDGPTVDEGPLPVPATQWLLAGAVVINPPTPLQWHVGGEWSSSEVFGAKLSARMQSLSLDQGSTTTPRKPVGDPLPLEFIVTDTGDFTFTIESLPVVGAANPITGGDILAQDVTFTGRFAADDVWCGTLTGMVTAPLMLDLVGSTFAAVPIDSVDELPLEFPAACE